MIKGIKGILAFMGIIFLCLGLLFLGVSAFQQHSNARCEEGAVSAEGVFLIVGGVFSVIGAGFLIAVGLHGWKRKKLEETGTRVTAQVTDVQRVYAVRINGRHPYVIHAVCEHPYTRQQMKVKSGCLMQDPTGRIQNGQVTVLVDPMYDKRYYMEADRFM